MFGAPRCSIIVDDYDPAISFFAGALGSELVEDTPSMTSAGNPGAAGGRSPADAQTGILLVRADGDDQSAAVGKQAAGRAGFFLQTDDFEGTCQRMRSSSTWPGTAGICWVPRDRWI